MEIGLLPCSSAHEQVSEGRAGWGYWLVGASTFDSEAWLRCGGETGEGKEHNTTQTNVIPLLGRETS